MLFDEAEINLLDHRGSTQRLQTRAGNSYAICQLERLEFIDGIDAQQNKADIDV